MVEIVIVWHDPVRIPVLDDRINGQPFQKAVDIQNSIESTSPQGRIRHPVVRVQNIEEALNVAPIRFIFI